MERKGSRGKGRGLLRPSVWRRTVRGAKERGAGARARDGHDARHGQVLNERARDDDAHGHQDARGDALDHRIVLLLGRKCILAIIQPLSQGLLRQRVRGRLVAVVVLEICDLCHIRLVVVVLFFTAKHDLLPVEGVRFRRLVEAARGNGLLKGDVRVLVRLLVKDDDVHVRRRQDVLLGPRLGRHHPVELANLRRALEQLQGLALVALVVGLRLEDAEAAVGLGLKALDALLEARDRAVAPLDILELLVGAKREVQQELRARQKGERTRVRERAVFAQCGSWARK